MTTYYWVGGTGTWAASGNTNFATSSGGTPGAATPGTGDTVIFDSNSNNGNSGASYTCTRTATAAVTSLQLANPSAGTLTFAGSSTIQTTGGLTVGSGVNWSNTGALTISGAQTVTTNGVSINSPITVSAASATVTLGSALTATTAFTLSAGTLALGNYNLTALTFVGSSTSAKGITTGTGAIYLTGNSTTIWTTGTTSNTFTPPVGLNVYCTYSGSSNTRTIVHSNEACGTRLGYVNFNITAGSDVIILGSLASNFNNVNFTGFTGQFKFGTNRIYGNLTLQAGSTNITGGSPYNFYGNSILTSNGVTLVSGISVLGTLTLGSALTSTNYISLNGGVLSQTLNLNGYNVTCDSFATSGTPSLFATNSFITLTTSGNAPWNVFSGFSSWDFTGSTIWFSSTTATEQDFQGSGTSTGYSYWNLIFGGGPGCLCYFYDDGDSFNTISSTNTSNWNLTLSAGTSVYVNHFNIHGSPGNIVTLSSDTPGTQANLVYSNTGTGTGVNNVSYVSIQDIAASGGVWNAFTSDGNTDLGNNTGWNFTAPTNNFFFVF